MEKDPEPYHIAAIHFQLRFPSEQHALYGIMWKNNCNIKTGKDEERRGDGLFYDTILPFHRTKVGTIELNMGLVKYAAELLST